MLRSKSRSGFFEFGQKNHSSVLSRSISASKFCRGDSLVSQIDKEALISVDRKPSKVVNSSEIRIDRVSRMQQQMGEIEEELRRTKEQLDAVKEERNRAIDELRETKQVAKEANMRINEGLSPKKAGEVFAELKALKELLSNSKGELAMKDKNIESLKVELEKAKQFELKLADKESSLDSLKEELLSNSKRDLAMKEKIIESLKVELEKAKQFEIKLAEREAFFDSLKEELRSAKDSEAHAKGELVMEEKNIESLKVELEKAKQFELKLVEREASFDSLKEELRNAKASEAQVTDKRIQELEVEVERGKISESKMLNSVAAQTKQLEETKIELEESKLKISSLREQMEKLRIPSKQNNTSDPNGPQTNNHVDDSTKESIMSLKSELQLAKENSSLLETELKLATDAEEKSKKAMDDLALALTEVAMEANMAKEKLSSTQVELEHVKEEGEKLKEMVRSTEEEYRKLLDEAKKETELHQNTADRLRLEAEESLLAWNGKEMGFVGCIKRAEEERSLAQHENTRLTESLKSAREESYKLRDILKQALNEANVAKAAASIATGENSQLKDFLAEKDEALHFLTRENERLRINEAAAQENIKELKRLLSVKPKELNSEDKEKGGLFRSASSVVEESEKGSRPIKTFSFDLNELKFMNECDDLDVTEVEDEDPVKAEALKGSIFDPTASPKSEPQTPKPVIHHRRGSSAFTDDGETPSSEDFDHLDGTHFDDADSERNSNRRRRSALLRRFGDLIMRKSFQKKEPQPQPQPQPPTE